MVPISRLYRNDRNLWKRPILIFGRILPHPRRVLLLFKLFLVLTGRLTNNIKINININNIIIILSLLYTLYGTNIPLPLVLQFWRSAWNPVLSKESRNGLFLHSFSDFNVLAFQYLCFQADQLIFHFTNLLLKFVVLKYQEIRYM